MKNEAQGIPELALKNEKLKKIGNHQFFMYLVWAYRSKCFHKCLGAGEMDNLL